MTVIKPPAPNPNSQTIPLPRSPVPAPPPPRDPRTAPQPVYVPPQRSK